MNVKRVDFTTIATADCIAMIGRFGKVAAVDAHGSGLSCTENLNDYGLRLPLSMDRNQNARTRCRYVWLRYQNHIVFFDYFRCSSCDRRRRLARRVRESKTKSLRQRRSRSSFFQNAFSCWYGRTLSSWKSRDFELRRKLEVGACIRELSQSQAFRRSRSSRAFSRQRFVQMQIPGSFAARFFEQDFVSDLRRRLDCSVSGPADFLTVASFSYLNSVALTLREVEAECPAVAGQRTAAGCVTTAEFGATTNCVTTAGFG